MILHHLVEHSELGAYHFWSLCMLCDHLNSQHVRAIWLAVHGWALFSAGGRQDESHKENMAAIVIVPHGERNYKIKLHFCNLGYNCLSFTWVCTVTVSILSCLSSQPLLYRLYCDWSVWPNLPTAAGSRHASRPQPRVAHGNEATDHGTKASLCWSKLVHARATIRKYNLFSSTD